VASFKGAAAGRARGWGRGRINAQDVGRRLARARSASSASRPRCRDRPTDDRPSRARASCRPSPSAKQRRQEFRPKPVWGVDLDAPLAVGRRPSKTDGRSRLLDKMLTLGRRRLASSPRRFRRHGRADACAIQGRVSSRPDRPPSPARRPVSVSDPSEARPSPPRGASSRCARQGPSAGRRVRSSVPDPRRPEACSRRAPWSSERDAVPVAGPQR
jgi:hypothetical protein